MIKDRQKYLNRLHVVIDAVIIVLSYCLAYGIIFESAWQKGEPALPVGVYFSALYLIVPVYLLLYAIFQLYTPKRVQGRRLEASNIVKANVIGVLLFMTVLFLAKDDLVEFSRSLVACFAAINVFLEILMRNILRMILRSMRMHGFNQKHVLLVGYSRAAQGYIDRVKANPEWGYKIRGILDDNIERGTEYKGVKVLGPIANLEIILPANRLDEIAITLGLNEYSKLERIVAACEKSGVHTKFIPDYNSIIPTKPYTEDLQGLPVIHIRHVPLNNGVNAFMKRTMDIIGSLVAIILFSPIMLLAAIGVKLTSKGPVIYKQERVGRHNRPFYMYKFRSMEVQPPQEERTEWTKKGDPE